MLTYKLALLRERVHLKFPPCSLCKGWSEQCGHAGAKVISPAGHVYPACWLVGIFLLKRRRSEWSTVWVFLIKQLLHLPYWGSALHYLCRLAWGSSAAHQEDPPAEPWPSPCRWCPLPEGYAWFARPIPLRWPLLSLQLLAVKEWQKKQKQEWTKIIYVN